MIMWNCFDSGWQSEMEYTNGSFDPCSTYTFRVKARDLSANFNETDFSDPRSTTTATSGVDDLSPFPDPARWKATPRRIGGSGTNVTVAMEAYTASDESGVEYRFQEISGNPGGGFTSAWQDSPVYVLSGLSDVAPGFTYSFRTQTRDKSADQTETVWSTPLAHVQLFPPPQVREVPFPYGTIQAAITAATRAGTSQLPPDILVFMGVSSYVACVVWRLAEVSAPGLGPEGPPGCP